MAKTTARADIPLNVKDKKAVSQLKRFTKAFKDNATSWNQALALSGKIWRGVSAVPLAVARHTLEAAKTANEYGRAVAEVTTIADAAQFSVERIRDLTFDMTSLYGSDATENAQAFYQAISAGASSSAEANEILHASSKLAIGGVTDTTTAVDGLTSVVNAYRSTGAKANDVADAFFVAIKAGKTTAEELSAAIGTTAPIASQLGVNFDELLGSVAALTTNGVSTAEAFTQIRSAMVGVVKNQGKVQGLAKQLGIDFSVAALKAKGLKGFLVDLAASKPTEAQLLKLFGRVEGLSAVMGLAANNGQKLTVIMEAMEERAGAGDEAFRKMTGTLDFQVTRFNALSNAVQIAMGQLITDSDTAFQIMRGLNVALEDILDFFRDPAGRAAVENWVRGIAKGLSIVVTSFAGVLEAATNLRKEWALLTDGVFVEPLGKAGTLVDRLNKLADTLSIIGDGRGSELFGKLGGKAQGGRNVFAPRPPPPEPAAPPTDTRSVIERELAARGPAGLALFVRDQLQPAIDGVDQTMLKVSASIARGKVKVSDEWQTMWMDLGTLAENALQAVAQGIGATLANTFAQIFSGQQSILEALRSFFGGILIQMGTMLVQLGTAAVLAGAIGSVSPVLAGITGGPAAVSTGLAAIAGGAAMIGLGTLLGGAGQRAQTGPRTSSASGPGFRAGVAGRGQGGDTHYHSHFHGPVGNPRRAARQTLDEFRRAQSLVPAGGA